ncbi:hypothetical protein Megvenef_00990 [Candidatus Megaera venefica]|uniref:Uncharacterized protein n=1 Tax=Candidatus Megaera venefica TaxID=2055910 RepID=A0ABU5NCW8_9RICK|nr:hypothetical protein [Candidatus Megaera venefica]MEA0971019.1 hypothetical protein [Candidatus Megaera venefica]
MKKNPLEEKIFDLQAPGEAEHPNEEEEAEAVAAAEELIRDAMPGLYAAILARNIEATSEILEPLDRALEALGDVPGILNEVLTGAGIAPGHVGLRPGELAHQLGFHDICQFLVETQGDEIECNIIGEE